MPNAAPRAADDIRAIVEGSARLTGSVLSNDVDPEREALTVVGVGGAAGAVGTTITGLYGALTLNANGGYTYTLDNANPLVDGLAPGETVVETFSYTISDPQGATASAVLRITIDGRNDGPRLTGDAAAITVGAPAVIGQVLANDVDPEGEPLSVVSVTFGA